jgi:hypothetical protein
MSNRLFSVYPVVPNPDWGYVIQECVEDESYKLRINYVSEDVE